ncbi:AraC family transcriptional regulator [Litchfieldella qijiaojingensis]|uniref:AraC family transcriptional regulator n=1 Tax=Litchfieldella qijiaojingensis TaxID=980347 RepID=A0ABQ2YX19_9GAMM|nr:helix-turn-helix domain-containing protein [Halomonas qijiaojingensis]GGX95356.1 AraC family transcriptional regulator [Halomonas qijiaojingensis]
MSSAIRLIPLDNTTKHHDHDFHQIVIGLNGHAEFEIEGLGGSIASLSGCIVPANHVHYYEGIGENRQLILDLPVDTPSLTGPHHELSRLFDAPRFFTLDEPLRLYLNFLTQELSQPHHRHSLAQRQGQGDLLAATFLGCLHARLHPDLPAKGTNRLNLQALDRFIQRHLAERLTVTDLARYACLSEAHFSECFRAQTGLTPYQYLLRQRLGAVRHLLTSTRLPLSEIAAHTGFANQSALSHAFRRKFGHPPSQLRRSADKTASLLPASS